MASKRKSTKKRDANQITASTKPDDDEGVAKARTVLRPTVQAAVTVKALTQQFGEQDLTGLMEALSEQTKSANEGDLGRGEAMLATQAHTLDALFHTLVQRAIHNMGEYMGAAETYMKLALRAQSQCRATWEALSAIKNPPMAGYVGQANIAHGHQQINNADIKKSGDPCARENKIPPNELLEQKHGSEWLDTGAAGKAGATDSELEAVGEIDRPDQPKREGNFGTKRL